MFEKAPSRDQSARRALVVLILGSLLSLGFARPAEACAPPMCLAGWFVPPDGTAEGTVFPANFGGMLWVPRNDWGTHPVAHDAVALFDLGTEPPTEIPVTLAQSAGNSFVLTPTQPLLPDRSYRVLGADYCQGTGQADETATVREFRTGPAADPPTELGTLQLSAPAMGELSVSAAGGSCAETISAIQIPVRLELSASALPWKDAFLYGTWVDGERWGAQHSIKDQVPPGTSWQGRGEDLLFHRCAANDLSTDPGLGEGTHRVRFEAELPGLGISLSTPEVEFELRCGEPDAGIEEPDAGVVETDAGTEVADAGAIGEDGGESSEDAGEMAVDAGAADDEPVGPAESGCGCAGSGSSGAPGWMALAVSALWLTRPLRGSRRLARA